MYEFEYFKFKHSLKEPLPVINTLITYKEGFYLVLKNNNQVLGIGEVSPLPGLSKENLHHIEPIIKTLRNKKKYTESCLKLLTKQYKNLPSLIFALESILLCINKKTTTQNILSHSFFKTINSNKITKYPLIKYKIGINNLNTDINAINKLIKAFPEVKFRFDANYRLTLEQITYFFNNINKANVDYVEDPCKIDSLNEFYSSNKVNYMIDSPTKNEFKKNKFNGLSGLIIKPTILGSIENILYLKNLFNIERIIISSTYETKVGIQGLLNYSTLLAPKETHGINTEYFYSYFNSKEIPTVISSLNMNNLYIWVKKNAKKITS